VTTVDQPRVVEAGPSTAPTRGDVQRWFDAVEAPGPTLDVHADSVADVKALCARPELGPLLRGVSVSLHADGPPSAVIGSCRVSLSTAVLSSPVDAAVTLRQALERLVLDRVTAGVGSAVVGEAAARVVAAAYRSMLSPAGEYVVPLPWPSADARSAPRPDLEVAMPVELLLTTGGDDRLLVDPATMLNQYGCSPKPRPEAITFSSSTASSISEVAFAAAEALRQRLLAAALVGQAEACGVRETHADTVRARLARLLGLEELPGSDVVLTSSGTDGELYALHIALGASSRGLLNIVLAPDETGSGTVAAASGRHFATRTPLGDPVDVRMPIVGFPVGDIKVECVDIRSPAGSPVAEAAISDTIAGLLRTAADEGRPALLHLLDSSKTGLSAPTFETVLRLRENARTHVDVVVDAAQMRVSFPAIRRYLRAGFMVLVSGSKFYTGPPFAGALIVPPDVAERVDRLPPLPSGMADYAAIHDVPKRWRALTSHLREENNLGLLLRWEAALTEMEAFGAVPVDRRYRTLERFGIAVTSFIECSSTLQLVAAPAVDRAQGAGVDRWDTLPSIFSFLVRQPDGRALDFEEAKCVYGWLNSDISDFLVGVTGEDSRLAATKCHIGQPVPYRQIEGRVLGALRVSAGARLVSGVEFDQRLGATADERLATEIQGALTVLEKVILIARNWPALNTHARAGLASIPPCVTA